MEIDINKCIYDYKRLIEDAKLTQANRQEHLKSLQAFKKLVQEWEQFKIEKNNHGNDDK